MSECFGPPVYHHWQHKPKTYHQYHNSIKGIPKFFEVKEIQHEGKTLKFMELTLIDGEVSNKVSVPLKNVKAHWVKLSGSPAKFSFKP